MRRIYDLLLAVTLSKDVLLVRLLEYVERRASSVSSARNGDLELFEARKSFSIRPTGSGKSLWSRVEFQGDRSRSAFVLHLHQSPGQ